jgi:hypothetical protein
MTIELWTTKPLADQIDQALRGKLLEVHQRLQDLRSQLAGHKDETTLYGGKLPTALQIEENEMAEIPTGEV